jgi:tRNA(fMet)-specific endonuclease VapC
MKYLLDTNIVSLLMKGDVEVIAHLKRVGRADVLLAQPVIAEISYGLARLPRSKRKAALQSRFELLKSELRRVDWSDEVSQAFGEVKAALERSGERIEDFDAAVAAHALVTDGSVLVSSSLEHMKRIPGLVVEDWSR